MPGRRETTNSKLRGVPANDLRQLAKELGYRPQGRHAEIAYRLLDCDPTVINEFIQRKYAEKVRERQQTLISDAALLSELNKVQAIEWGTVQGQLDRKIQTEYVRRITRFDDLVAGVASRLHSEVTNYAIASWYNHWSTVLIEDHISQHRNVVPTIKNIKGIDLFFRDYPFDLKITYLPGNYNTEDAIAKPAGLARWLYENQGAQRFGAENRFYIVLIDTADVSQSWKLKRDIALIHKRIDAFLDRATVSEDDTLPFVFNRESHTPLCKTLLITQ